MRGFEVHRIGIEHTESIHGYDSTSIKRDPMFIQMQKTPDFLLIKNEKYYFLEVKYRSSPDARDSQKFKKYLVNRYLGGPMFHSRKQDTGEICQRTASRYWNMYRDVYLIFIDQENVSATQLKNLLDVHEESRVGKGRGRNKVFNTEVAGVKSEWSIGWDVPTPLSPDIKWFNDIYFKAINREALKDWMKIFED